MKGTFLRKIAAVGTGLALVAGSVVAAVNWSDLVDTNEKTMKINGIVVGAQAQPSDSTAAASLAAKLAEKFVYEKDTEVKEQVPVEGTAGLDDSKAISRKGGIGSDNDWLTMGKGQKLDVISESKSVVIDKSSKTVTFRETFGLDATSKYDTSKSAQELVSTIPKGNYGYTVTVGSLNLGTANYVADNENYVTLPFMGEWYELDAASSEDISLELVSEGNKDNWLAEGEAITGLASKDGTTTYKVVIANAYTGADSNNFVVLELYDESTGVKVSEQTAATGATVTFRSQGKKLLQESIKVKEIARRTVSSSDSFRVNLRTGLNRVVLDNGKCYPNSEETASKNKCDWEVFVNFKDANTLSNYGLKTVTEKVLSIEDSIILPENYGAIKFLGLNSEDSSVIEIGQVIKDASGDASETGLVYVDEYDVTRYIPFYYKSSISLADVNDYDGFTLELDNKEFGLYFATDDSNVLNFLVEEGEYDSAMIQDDLGYADQDTTIVVTDLNLDKGAISDKDVTFKLEGINVNYKLAVQRTGTSSYNLWLVLAAQEFDNVRDGRIIEFLGTTLDDSNSDLNVSYYALKGEDFASVNKDINADFSEDDQYFYTAIFEVEVFDGNVAIVYIDADTGLLTNDGDSDNSLSWAMQYPDVTGGNLRVKSGERKTYLSSNGDFLEIVDDEFARITIPEKALQVEYLFFDKTGVTGETSYEEKVVTKKVKTVFGNVPTSSILDNEAGSGKYIVVGGYAVNSLFQKVAKDADEAAEFFGTSLAQEGDKVTKLHAGNLYVAGYTAQDTIDAVDALIKELDSFEW